MKAKTSSLLPSAYAPLLADLKARVRAAQVKAAVSVNRELILLYWHIGCAISQARQAGAWGANVVERLAKDLAAEFPEMSGFSYTNVKRMRAFAEAYGAIEIGSQPVGQLTASILQQVVAPLPSKLLDQLLRLVGVAKNERFAVKNRPIHRKHRGEYCLCGESVS
mgnify:CR=1 FL=1